VKDGQPEVAVLPTTAPVDASEPAALRRMPNLLLSSRSIRGAALAISGFAFGPESQRLAVGCGDGAGYLWNLASGTSFHSSVPTEAAPPVGRRACRGLLSAPTGIAS